MKKTRKIILISMFTALMTVGAFIKIPFPFIPITLQPFFCAFAGILLGSKAGSLSQLVYVVLGLTGLPIFTQGGGITYIFQPSFGFLLGFIAGAFVIGKVSEKLKTINLRNSILSVMSGLVTIYIIGIPYMYFILKYYIKKPEVNILFPLYINFPFFIKDIVLYIIVAITATSIIPKLIKAGLVELKE